MVGLHLCDVIMFIFEGCSEAFQLDSSPSSLPFKRHKRNNVSDLCIKWSHFCWWLLKSEYLPLIEFYKCCDLQQRLLSKCEKRLLLLLSRTSVRSFVLIYLFLVTSAFPFSRLLLFSPKRLWYPKDPRDLCCTSLVKYLDGIKAGIGDQKEGCSPGFRPAVKTDSWQDSGLIL